MATSRQRQALLLLGYCVLSGTPNMDKRFLRPLAKPIGEALKYGAVMANFDAGHERLRKTLDRLQEQQRLTDEALQEKAKAAFLTDAASFFAAAAHLKVPPKKASAKHIRK